MLHRVLGVVSLLLAFFTVNATAKENILYNFTGSADGGSPQAGLVHDRFGNLYGTTSRGGAGRCFGLGCGTVFQLKQNGDGSWTKNTIHTFSGDDEGGVPVGTLAIDSKGNLFGVTEQGGMGPCDSVLGGGCGVVYALSPKNDGSWAFHLIYTFSHPGSVDDGAYPDAGVIVDKQDNLYGTTEFGGSFVCDCGIVYKLSPNAGQWKETVLYSFVGISQGGSDVSFPTGPVTLDANGNIFGTGSGGGDVLCDLGCGGVFLLAPNGDGPYDEQVLHIFEGGSDGSEPETGLTLDPTGNIFGTTAFGGGGTGCANGDNGCGTIFKMTPSNGDYQFQIIFSFAGPNGYAPFGELLRDAKGNLYGTTEGGGTANAGVGFRLSQAGGQWKETALYSFGIGSDGATPTGPVMGSTKSGFFGTTAGGGASDWGTVFQLK